MTPLPQAPPIDLLTMEVMVNHLIRVIGLPITVERPEHLGTDLSLDLGPGYCEIYHDPEGKGNKDRAWLVTVSTYIPGTYDTPPDVDVIDIYCGPSWEEACWVAINQVVKARFHGFIQVLGDAWLERDLHGV